MNIGLVLSGGMAKGAYQIGALRAISEFVPREEIKYISCASVGVLNGYAYATNDLDCAENIWRNICSEDVRLFVGHILRSTLFQQNIKSLYDPDKPLDTTFYAPLFDVAHRNVVYKDLSQVEPEQIPLYLKASVALPLYNRSVPIDNTSYFDGAMIDNIPVYPLLKHELDYVLCVYFDDTGYKFESSQFDSRVIKITFPDQDFLRQSLFCRQDGIEEMIAVGYEQTRHLLELVFAEGYDNLDYIYRAIRYLGGGKGKMRITADILVTNLNKIMQKLIRRNIL